MTEPAQVPEGSAAKAGRVLVSHTGVVLTRDVAFRFALDPTVAQQEAFFRYAGRPGSRSTTIWPG